MKRSLGRYQFHLSSLLIFMTVAAVVFALIGRFGVSGFFQRLGVAITFAGIFVPLLEFYFWWKENMEEPLAGPSDAERLAKEKAQTKDSGAPPPRATRHS